MYANPSPTNFSSFPSTQENILDKTDKDYYRDNLEPFLIYYLK